MRKMRTDDAAAAASAVLPGRSGPGAGRRGRVLLAAALAAACLAACTSTPESASTTGATRLPQGGEAARLDPADFTVDITNKYWPMKVGDRWIYEAKDENGAVTRDEITVLDSTEKVNGIEARVVHDLATRNGATIEDTTDWFAQDSAGNIWYLGEETAEYENGRVVSTEGSWRAGTDGAQAGVLIPAQPRPGLAYRQEYLKGEAEDRALVLSTSEQVETASGRYKGALLTRDTTPLEPDLVELKWYAPGVGPVLTLTPSGEVSREELVTPPGAG